jgi:hypothetical protein
VYVIAVPGHHINLLSREYSIAPDALVTENPTAAGAVEAGCGKLRCFSAGLRQAEQLRMFC